MQYDIPLTTAGFILKYFPPTSGEQFSVVRISDDGPGIPEDEIGSVFKPFYRADKARHWQQDGFGIGLAIADRAVNLNGGAISIRNKKDGGLVVEMRLPLVVDVPQASVRNDSMQSR